jgi:hypothetical protein
MECSTRGHPTIHKKLIYSPPNVPSRVPRTSQKTLADPQKWDKDKQIKQVWHDYATYLVANPGEAEEDELRKRLYDGWTKGW